MKLPAFAGGMCVGLVVGAMLDMSAHASPKVRKTAVGKAMRRLGHGMDAAWLCVTSKLH